MLNNDPLQVFQGILSSVPYEANTGTEEATPASGSAHFFLERAR